GVGVDGDDIQLHVGRFPHPLAHGPRDGQNLPGNMAMQRIYESPESGLHRQLGDFENARQDRIACEEAQLVQSRKADVEAEHDASTNRYRFMARGSRFEVRACSTRAWKPSLSSI